MTVQLYTKRGCHLCDDTLQTIEKLRGEWQFSLQVIDINSDPELLNQFGCSIPVVTINHGQRVALRINEERLRRAFELAQRRSLTSASTS